MRPLPLPFSATCTSHIQQLSTTLTSPADVEEDYDEEEDEEDFDPNAPEGDDDVRLPPSLLPAPLPVPLLSACTRSPADLSCWTRRHWRKLGLMGAGRRV